MTNTVSTLEGLFKETYADKIEDLIPDGVMFYKDAAFVPRKKQNGNQYHQPVVLTNEHGFTYQSASAGAFSVNSAVAAQHDDATVTGTQLLLESNLDYESAARAKGSPNAFKAATAHLVENMTNSTFKRLEIMSLYGGSKAKWGGLFRVGSRTDDSGTTQTYNVYTGTWAPGIMAGLENAPVDLYDDDGTSEAPSTKLNTGGDVTISSVDFANKRVTFTGVEADLDKLTSAPATACYVYFKGAFGKEFSGAVTVFSNTGSLFGIDGSSYALWQGNTYDASSTALTFDKAIRAFDGPVGRGLAEKAVLMVNPSTWTNLMTDLAALRYLDGSYSKRKLENGSMGISYAAQFGELEVKSSTFIKEGMAIGYAPRKLIRVGAADVGFTIPGTDERMMWQLPSNAGYGMRVYANQALFHPCPAYNVLIEDIVNS